ncbi:22.0 kDa heat shock protein-like [Euphorbia lathyris]|uniref:22.0 kDa heat shock protein-like n=1 Tax=Euphorbia lathyris TaxID=212925 RepID=UPI0033137C79
MAYVGGRRRVAESSTGSVKEFVPYAAWTEDSLNHFLLVDLPEFKKEEVKLQVEKSGEITISGKRLVNDNNYLYFEKTYKAPSNSDLEKVTGKFEGEILYVNVPKQAQDEVSEKKILESPENKKEDEKIIRGNIQEKIINKEEMMEKLSNEEEEEEGSKREKSSMLQRAIFMVKKNSHILVTAALAFTLGVLVSRKIETCPPPPPQQD